MIAAIMIVMIIIMMTIITIIVDQLPHTKSAKFAE